MHLFSFQLRPDSFVEETGGFTGLQKWQSDDWKHIIVKLASGSFELFHLVDCPSQLPLGQNPKKSFYLHYKGTVDTSDSYIDPHLKLSENGISEYFHPFYREFVKFGSEIPLPHLVAFCPESQTIAICKDSTLEVRTIHATNDVLSWSIDMEEGGITELTWSCDGERLFFLNNSRRFIYSRVGCLLFEHKTNATSLLVVENNLILSGVDALEVIPLIRNISQPCSHVMTLDFATDSQVLCFRKKFFTSQYVHLKWNTVDLYEGYNDIVSSPNDECFVLFNPGLAIFTNGHWKIDHSEVVYEHAGWLSNGLFVTIGCLKKKYTIYLRESESDLTTIVNSLDLPGRCLYFTIASFTNHLIVMFEDMSVHVYHITYTSRGKVGIEFSLNLSLGFMDSRQGLVRTQLTKWQIDLFERATLSSPSETKSVEPKKIAIENLLFLQGDSLFTVIIRSGSQENSVTAVPIEAKGVERFFMLNVANDLWLITLHCGELHLRRWPFSHAVDIVIEVKFRIDGFYPDLGLSILLSVEEQNNQLYISQSKALIPLIAKFYLEQNDHVQLQNTFMSLNEKALLFEYLCLEVLEMSNRLKSNQLLCELHRHSSSLLPRVGYTQSLINLARKIDVEQAKRLFNSTYSAETLFADCVNNGDLEYASNILMLRLVLDSDVKALTAEEKVPILKLVDSALSTCNYGLITEIYKFVSTISPSDLDLVSGAITVAAKELMKHHRWVSFYNLSTSWNPSNPMALFDECFGKMNSDNVRSLLNEIDMESRICAIFLENDADIPTIELVRKYHRQSLYDTTILTTRAHSSTSLLTVSPSPSLAPKLRTIEFLEMFEELAETVLIWRIVLFADKESIQRLERINSTLWQDLRAFLISHRSLSWICNCK